MPTNFADSPRANRPLRGWHPDAEAAARQMLKHGRPTRLKRDAHLPMHTIFFGLKRAHHGVLRVVRSALAQLGLTAARFDLLYAVLEREGVPQVELCQALGVSAATVSRMLSSLEKLGLIARHTTVVDRRLRHVSLTDDGRRIIEEAIDRFITWRSAQLAIDSALCPRRWSHGDLCSRFRRRLEKTLDKIRYAYRDTADLYRPWEPDADGSPIWDAVSLEPD